MTHALVLVTVLSQLAAATLAAPARFDGNHALDEPTLAAAFAHGEGDVERGTQWVLAAYYDHGYADARIEPLYLTVRDAPMLVLRVHEGATYEWGRVELRGDTLGLVPPLPTEGSPMVRSAVVNAIEAARAAYQARGYHAVVIDAEARKDAGARVLHLSLVVRAGERS